MAEPNPDLNLHILVIDEHPERAAILQAGLLDAGYGRVTLIAEMTNLLARIYQLDPDVLLIDLENPSRDVLEQMFQVSRVVRRPVAMFVDQSDGATIEAAIEAGVSAYIVDGLKRERVRPILDTTISRFRTFSRMQAELDAAKSALEDRKIIDRAKGIIMQQKGVTEAEAYALLRKSAMNHNKKIAEIAESVVRASELLG